MIANTTVRNRPPNLFGSVSNSRNTDATMVGSFPCTPHPNAGRIRSVHPPKTNADNARLILSVSEYSNALRFSSYSVCSKFSFPMDDRSIILVLRLIIPSIVVVVVVLFSTSHLYSLPDRLDVVNAFGAGSVTNDTFSYVSSNRRWRNRGEYYLRNAEGDRTQTCLRLAAKCFDKAGEANRRDYALAFLSFVEIEEQDQVDKSSNTKLRGKHSVEVKEKLYSVTEQMLQARDLEFLSKAGK